MLHCQRGFPQHAKKNGDPAIWVRISQGNKRYIPQGFWRGRDRERQLSRGTEASRDWSHWEAIPSPGPGRGRGQKWCYECLVGDELLNRAVVLEECRICQNGGWKQVVKTFQCSPTDGVLELDHTGSGELIVYIFSQLQHQIEVWNLSWCKYLYHGHGQKLLIRTFFLWREGWERKHHCFLLLSSSHWLNPIAEQDLEGGGRMGGAGNRE